MKEQLIELIMKAEEYGCYDLLMIAERIINELATTYNAPSDWRSIGEELIDYYKDNGWVYDGLRLRNYEDDEDE